ncbi:MAG: hypothetical protein KGQ42_09740, partial [Alphaproteobacteria bacterium]|nr:hypothetical protein [Alphaproteobacteria bacterium]
MDDNNAEGSSKSLNKTISELIDYMNDDGVEIDSVLRVKMYYRFAEISRWWAEEGFKIGVRETLNTLGIQEITSPSISYDFGDALLAPGVRQKLPLS